MLVRNEKMKGERSKVEKSRQDLKERNMSCDLLVGGGGRRWTVDDDRFRPALQGHLRLVRQAAENDVHFT